MWTNTSSSATRPRPRPAAAQDGGETLAEFPAPAPDSLIRDDDAPFSQKQLDLPQAKAERRGREPAAEVRVGDGFMSASLNRLSPDYQNGLP
jgi:hypothetical protein